MNNTIYNALYRTIEDRLNIADGGSGPERILLYEAIGEDGKYSIATYVQATIAIGDKRQDVSFRLHVKNEESTPADQTPEKYFVEITDIAPATGKGLKEDDIPNDPDELDDFDVDAALDSITGALSSTPIKIYLKMNKDTKDTEDTDKDAEDATSKVVSVSYWMHVQGKSSSRAVYFTKCTVRHEIFFGGFLGHLSAIEDENASSYSEGEDNLLATINGDVSNIMRSLQIDTLLNESLIIDTLNTNIAVASTLAANNATINEATFKKEVTVSGGPNENGEYQPALVNFGADEAGTGCKINLTGGAHISINSGSNVTFGKNVDVENYGKIQIGNLHSTSDINIEAGDSAIANVKVTTLVTKQLKVTQSEKSTWDDIALLNPNKMLVGNFDDKNDEAVRWSKLVDGDVAANRLCVNSADVGNLYFTGQIENVTQNGETIQQITHKITSIINNGDLKVDGDTFANKGLFDADEAVVTAKTLKTLLGNIMVSESDAPSDNNKRAAYTGQVVYIVR